MNNPLKGVNGLVKGIGGLALGVAGAIYLWNLFAVTPGDFERGVNAVAASLSTHTATFETHVDDASEQIAILIANDREICRKLTQSDIDRINNLILDAELKKAVAADNQVPILLRYIVDLERQVREKLEDKDKC